MLLDHLIDVSSQLGSVPALAHLINDGTLKGYLASFLLVCRVNNLSPRTMADYSSKIGRFLDFCRPFSNTPGEVTTDHVRLFILDLQRRIKPSSVHDYYRAINRFFNWLVEEGDLKESPMARMRPPKVPRQIITPFKPEQIERLLALCDDSLLGIRNRAIILTFLDTGLRLAELAGIQLADIDIDHETIKVMGKGARERLVRIGKQAQKAILRYLLKRRDALPCLWITEECRPMRWGGIQIMIRRLGRRAGLTNVRCTPHTFRHTFGTQSLGLGADLREVQSLLGHSTLTMTLKYVATVNSEKAVIGHRRFSPADNILK
jgi:integrase/recombinase XerC/integrase/recombinase XerD